MALPWRTSREAGCRTAGMWRSLPACASCYAMCSDVSVTCADCNRYVCGKCVDNHMLYDDTQHPITLCCACACQYTSDVCSTSDEGASSSSVESFVGNTYNFLREVWEYTATTKLKDGYWVTMSQLNILADHPLMDVGTWMMLSLTLAAKLPRGIVVFDLDRQKCIVCAPGQVPSRANVNSAVSWMRWMGNQTIGIALRDTSLACFNVHRDVRDIRLQECKAISIHAAAGLSPIDF